MRDEWHIRPVLKRMYGASLTTGMQTDKTK
jgi:hypothetical protein